jgi:hypothetical protein
MRTPLRQLALSVFVYGLLVSGLWNAFAQSTTSLRGTVTDVQGGVIPGVMVTLSNTENGWSRQLLTDGVGAYAFLQVAPGTYAVKAEKVGFTTLAKDTVKLLVNTPTTLDLKMEVGKSTETVNVTAEAAAVNTTDASIGNPFSERQVRQLPLQTRNVVELLSLQPGVSPSGEVLGARRDQNNVTLDGADVNNNQNSGLVAQNTNTITGGFQGSNANGANSNPGFNAVLPIPLDSVQEFRVTVAGEGPSVGRSSGGQVALVTKSGSNQLHGSLYEFNRNTATAANTWLNNQAGVPVQPLVRNQFGGSVGGKVVKDRVFYFLNYEERRDASGVSTVRAVPSDTLRQGNLTFLLTDGSTKTLTPSDLRQVDPQNLGVSLAMQKVLNQYPHGNDPSFGEDGGLNFSGFRFNAPSHRTDRAIVGTPPVSTRSAFAGHWPTTPRIRFWRSSPARGPLPRFATPVRESRRSTHGSPGRRSSTSSISGTRGSARLSPAPLGQCCSRPVSIRCRISARVRSARRCPRLTRLTTSPGRRESTPSRSASTPA